MNTTLQWGIPALITILALFAGRQWGLRDRRIEHDKEVLDAILVVLPSSGSIDFIRRYDFGGSFVVENLDDLSRFISFSERPEVRFQDKKTECLRQSLVEAALNFNSFINLNTFPVLKASRNINRIKQPHEYENQAEYMKDRDELNNLADEVCKTYDSLISSANKKGIFSKIKI